MTPPSPLPSHPSHHRFPDGTSTRDQSDRSPTEDDVRPFQVLSPSNFPRSRTLPWPPEVPRPPTPSYEQRGTPSFRLGRGQTAAQPDPNKNVPLHSVLPVTLEAPAPAPEDPSYPRVSPGPSTRYLRARGHRTRHEPPPTGRRPWGRRVVQAFFGRLTPRPTSRLPAHSEGS